MGIGRWRGGVPVARATWDPLRLATDARRSNSRFAVVGPVELASGPLFGDLEWEASEKVFLLAPSTLTTPWGGSSILAI